MFACLHDNSSASCNKRGPVAGQISVDGQQLREIEAALARIGEGRYGVCANCGGEISRARLKGNPTVKYCTACQVGAPAESSTRE
jgi:DnaK suppressor protein